MAYLAERDGGAVVILAGEDRQVRRHGDDNQQCHEAGGKATPRDVEIAAGLAVADEQRQHAAAGGHQFFEETLLLRHGEPGTG